MNAKSYIQNLALGLFISSNVSKYIKYSSNHWGILKKIVFSIKATD